MSVTIPPSPRDLGLAYDRWQPTQVDALKKTLDDLTKVTPIVDLAGADMPVGSGKSLFAVALCKLYLPTLELPSPRAAILTGTKALQDQYSHDFKGIVTDIRGMGNYPCEALNRREFIPVTINKFWPDKRFPAMCDCGPCLLRYECGRKQSGCTYFDTLRAAKLARIVVTNYAYWLQTTQTTLGSADLVICDEAHLLRNQLDSAAKLSHPDLPNLGLDQTREWATRRLRELEDKGESTIAQVREKNTLSKLSSMDGNWVRDEGGGRGGHPSWSPVVFKEEGDVLAESGRKFVLMSGTLTEDHITSLRAAVSRKISWTMHSFKSTFPVSNRRVLMSPATYDGKYVRVGAKMSEGAANAHLAHVLKIVKLMEPSKRKGILHCISYTRAQMLYDQLLKQGHDRSLLYFPKMSSDIPRAIEAFKAAKGGGIILSPSLTTGYDFPQEACRWQVVFKCPFPDTRAPLIHARMKIDKAYSTKIMLETLAQMAGRGSRSQDDWVETYVCDAHLKWALFVPGIAPRTLKEAYHDIGTGVEAWIARRGKGR